MTAELRPSSSSAALAAVSSTPAASLTSARARDRTICRREYWNPSNACCRPFCTGIPSTSTRPEVGCCSPVITLARVDLPAPLGPVSSTAEPGSKCRFNPLKIWLCQGVPASWAYPTSIRLTWAPRMARPAPVVVRSLVDTDECRESSAISRSATADSSVSWVIWRTAVSPRSASDRKIPLTAARPSWSIIAVDSSLMSTAGCRDSAAAIARRCS